MSGKQTDYRVAVFGCGEVGKSALVNRFVNNSFRDVYVPTIEDTYRQIINCNKQVCTLEITDTTGSHQFPAMQQLCISKGHAFVLVYSITNKKSFEELVNIHNQLFRIKLDELTQTPLMIVGNKSDEEVNRTVSTAQGQALAKRLCCGFIETSAKTNENVTEMFQELLKMETRRNIALVMTTSHNSFLKRFLALSSRKKDPTENDPSKRKGVFQFGSSVPPTANGKVDSTVDKLKKKEEKAKKKQQKKEAAIAAKEEKTGKKKDGKSKDSSDEKQENGGEKEAKKCLVM